MNWCQELGTVLANEEVIDGKSEVGGFPVERRPLRQWILRITAMAERLDRRTRRPRLAGRHQASAAKLDRPLGGCAGRVRPSRRVRRLHLRSSPRARTRCSGPPTWFSPRSTHWWTRSPRRSSATRSKAYQKQVSSKSDLERTELAKDKTGVFTGAFAINPSTTSVSRSGSPTTS